MSNAYNKNQDPYLKRESTSWDLFRANLSNVKINNNNNITIIILVICKILLMGKLSHSLDMLASEVANVTRSPKDSHMQNNLDKVL